MSIEESGMGNVRTCGDVHGWNRLSNVKLNFDTVDNRATLTFDRPTYKQGKIGKRIEEIVVW